MGMAGVELCDDRRIGGDWQHVGVASAIGPLQLGGDGENFRPNVFVAAALAINASVFLWVRQSTWGVVILRHHLIRQGADGGGEAGAIAQVRHIAERIEYRLSSGAERLALSGSLRGDGGRFPALKHSRSIGEEPRPVWEVADVAG
jgi:hypothetical protein